ncbi:hypothetical protein ACJX0J_015563, partial [Zea mays]
PPSELHRFFSFSLNLYQKNLLITYKILIIQFIANFCYFFIINKVDTQVREWYLEANDVKTWTYHLIWWAHLLTAVLKNFSLTEIVVTSTISKISEMHRTQVNLTQENIIVLFNISNTTSVAHFAWLGKGTLVNSLPLLEQENLKKIEGIGPNLDLMTNQQNDGEQTQTLQQGKIVEVEENSRSSIEHRRVTKLHSKLQIFKI